MLPHIMSETFNKYKDNLCSIKKHVINVKYNIKAVILHPGGHFTILIKLSKKDTEEVGHNFRHIIKGDTAWFYFNDTRVSIKSELEALEMIKIQGTYFLYEKEIK